MDCNIGNLEWYDSILHMRPHIGLTSTEFNNMEDQYFIQLEGEILGEKWLESSTSKILDAKYELTNVATVVNDLQHFDQN